MESLLTNREVRIMTDPQEAHRFRVEQQQLEIARCRGQVTRYDMAVDITGSQHHQRCLSVWREKLAREKDKLRKLTSENHFVDFSHLHEE